MKKLILILLIATYSCTSTKTVNNNDLGYITFLPRGTYTLQQCCDGKTVRATREDGKYYHVKQYHFNINGIPYNYARNYNKPIKIKLK